MLGKQGKTGRLAWVAIIVIGLYFLSKSGGIGGFFGTSSTPAINVPSAVPPSPTSTPPATPPSTASLSNCPDTQRTAIAINMRNKLNLTTSQTFDATMNCYKDLGSGNEEYYTQITDTTNPTATNFPCNTDFVCKTLRTNANPGVNSRVLGIDNGKGTVKDGNIYFHTDGSDMTLNLQGSQHGVLEARVFDVINNAYMYDSGDAANTDYETTGAVFSSTTANTTNTTVGAGGEYHVKVYYRSSTDYTDFNDLGHYIAFDAPTTTWNKPTVKIEGTELSDIKGTLDQNEAAAWSGYEYIYKYDKSIPNTKEAVLDLQVFALSGVNPATGGADDIYIRFLGIGQYSSVAGTNLLKRAGADDTASKANVYTIQNFQLAIA